MRSPTRQPCTHALPSAIPLSSLTLSQVEADAHLMSSHALSLLQGCRAPMPSLLPSPSLTLSQVEANAPLTPSHARHHSRKGCRASSAQPSAHHPPP
ncbi:hypothetical protein L210DRAFT_955492 [Boletus edulis BED1]|uniref:Uncharacterized protein n=1 Tax=Boletus edulis BED1 TaxID=1328754 RepID=A0AAD4BS20_BOLED|nr:hypothetical protein L210DRAFT_955492 [Boletus edulis BED1]